MAASRWEWGGAKCRRVRRGRLGGTAAKAASRSSKTKRAPLCSGALSITGRSLLLLRGGLGGRRRGSRAGGRVHLHAGVHRSRGRSHCGSGGVGSCGFILLGRACSKCKDGG